MAKQQLSHLKNAFSAGKRPTQQDFEDLLDSAYNGHETIWVSGYGFFEEKTRYDHNKNSHEFQVSFKREKGCMMVSPPDEIKQKPNITKLDQEELFKSKDGKSYIGKLSSVLYGYRLHMPIPTPYNNERNFVKWLYLSIDFFNDDKEIAKLIDKDAADIIANIKVALHHPLPQVNSVNVTDTEAIDYFIKIRTKRNFFIATIQPTENAIELVNNLPEMVENTTKDLEEGTDEIAKELKKTYDYAVDKQGRLISNILEKGGLRFIPLVVNLPINTVPYGGGLSVTIDVVYEIDLDSIQNLKGKMVDKFYGIGAVFTSEPPTPPAL